MFCSNCSKEVSEKALACPGCGVPPGGAGKFCHNCAAPTDAKQAICLKCGVALTNASAGGKSKMMAGILGVIPCTTALGIHRFYLGNMGLGIAHVIALVVGVVTMPIVIGIPILIGNLIWGIIEGVMIFTGSISKDASGNTLKP